MEEAKPLASDEFPQMIPQEAMEIIDGARTYGEGKPPTTIRSADGAVQLANIWRNRPPQTILGAVQKAWFLQRLKESPATWKIWGNTTATLDMRADLQNLPAGLTKRWPWSGYAVFPLQDWSTAYAERGEIYDFVRNQGITGFATVSGDRHSFWAGLAAKSLPPRPFTPVGVAFVTGSISAPGMVEALEHGLPAEHPVRALYVGQAPGDSKPQPTLNMLLRHGVRSCLEYVKSGDIAKARTLSNRDLSPHVSFVDMNGHGYSVVRASAETLETVFTCIPRPLERSNGDDGGALSYRVRCRAARWGKNQSPTLDVQILEGDPKCSI